MSKHMKKITFPAVERMVVDYVACDICRNIIVSSTEYDVDDIAVKRHKGTNYPEGGWGTDCDFDICSDCWETRLVPWLEAQGALTTEKEWNW